MVFVSWWIIEKLDVRLGAGQPMQVEVAFSDGFRLQEDGQVFFSLSMQQLDFLVVGDVGVLLEHRAGSVAGRYWNKA